MPVRASVRGVAWLALVVCSQPAVAAVDRAGTDRWMWVRSDEPILYPVSRNALLEFCSERQITGLYLGAGPDFRDSSTSEQALTDFLRLAHGRGLKVETYVSEPTYALRSRHRLVYEHLDWALSFGSGLTSTAFDGLQLDLAPDGLPEYQDDRETVLSGYLDLVSGCRDRIGRARTDFALGVCVPAWYDHQDGNRSLLTWHGQSAPLSFHLLDTLNALEPGQGYLAVMAYRDRASGSNGVIRHVRDEVAYARRSATNTRVVVGQETAPCGHEPSETTFWEEGEPALQRSIQLLRKAFGGHTVFGGVAINDYESYRKLRR